jgi:sugar lactone lactonase YvrE
MRFVPLAAMAAILLGGVVFVVGASAETAASKSQGTAVFVANGYDVTAYPIDSKGEVSPIALTTDMTDPNGIARDASGRIYLANFETNTITVYPANASGNVPPLAVIGGHKTRLANPAGIALDANGRIYVVNSSEYRSGSITVYGPLGASTGILDEAPISVVAGSNTLLDNPTGIALNSQGDIYVANELRVPVKYSESFDRGMLTVYRAGSSGNIAPIATIRGAATGLALPVGIALDRSSGNIYVANFYTANTSSNRRYMPSITEYAADSTGDVPPIAVIGGDNTGLHYPQGMVLDSKGNIYVADNSGTVLVYPASSKGNASPTATIAGTDTGLNGSSDIARDSDGNLYLSNSYGGPADSGSVTVYSSGSSGDAAPIATITSNRTGLNGASGIALGSSGKIFVANASGGGSIGIYPPGSYATGPPIAAIAGDDTELYYPFGIALDSAGNISVMNRSMVNNGATITEYPADSMGNVSPSATINIDSGGKNFPTGMAVDRGGGLYIANQGAANCNKRSCYQTTPDNVAVYPAGSDGAATPDAVIVGPNTRLASPSAVAVDRSGGIYVTNEGPVACTRGCGRCLPIPDGSGSVSVYAPGSGGDSTPTATISGPNTGLKFPYEIALDSNGNMYVLNSAHIGFACAGIVKTSQWSTIKTGFDETGIFADHPGDPILVFAAGSNGDVAPTAVIGGPFTGLNFYGSEGIAVGPTGP